MTATPALVAAMVARFGADRVQQNVPLAGWTTFKVGGPADVVLETRNSDDVVTALRIARAHGCPVRVIGGGSNILVPDEGVRGLVLRPRGGEVSLVGADLVKADAAVTINGLVRWTINRGLAGLEAWAGTPGTVGGAIYGNAQTKNDLTAKVDKVKDSSVRLAMVSAIDHLSPQGDAATADKLDAIVEADKKAGVNYANDEVYKIALKLRSRVP